MMILAKARTVFIEDLSRIDWTYGRGYRCRLWLQVCDDAVDLQIIGFLRLCSVLDEVEAWWCWPTLVAAFLKISSSMALACSRLCEAS